MPGFSIRIFIPQGTPDGLRIVDKSNWTGRAVVCPRSYFREMKSRPEFGKTGIYILTGPSENGDLPTIYVGEGDPTRPRLEQHFSNKDFWTSLMLFTSKDDNLNKAHVQYLESRLVELAREAKRCLLDNGNAPQLPSLSESDAADMDGYLGELLLICPILGLSAFEKPETKRASNELLFIHSRGVNAQGYESADGFVVKAGSEVKRETVPSIPRFVVTLRGSLAERGIVGQNGDNMKFSQDYTFDSPSTAAAVVLGANANGRIEWKDTEGRTLKEIQSSEVGE